ncbi:pyruvate:ferredoxin (flavodoxin) oxidoreductase [Vulcanococcus sp.]|jgi:pyruvate-ferredoxin/flavodoxin oxidoreductase|uniref:pyruvate:ferredoxin (flavodoxin) oxidoreductase n=1 Tax=Vulcanococcus sp. TaxID=2856995 RepID=UPI0037DA22AF
MTSPERGSGPTTAWLDGNEAVARVAYRLSEVVALFPITPATPMGEWADRWASEGRPNLWGQAPQVVEMQSEAGAAGVVHGALQVGALTTTFTASQGLLLMLPSLYKIAGELNAAVIHVASRALATSALSIFGDHSDVMAARGTGCGLLCSATVQEAGDCAAIAMAATLAGRVPLLHAMDGFRTSHEIQRVELISDAVLQALVPEALIAAHRQRGLSPDRPMLRGTSQNPDVAFQAREAVNPYTDAMPARVQAAMDQFAALTGRQYHLFDYHGHPQAERVLVLMGSGASTAGLTADVLIAAGEPVGVLTVRLFRPLAAQTLVAALPASTSRLAVLDRCKEPGSQGEPLLLDVIAAIHEHWPQPQKPAVIGGRYGLASKEFTPAMVKAVFDNLAQPTPRNHFTVGIHDDLTHHSLTVEDSWELESPQTLRAVFVGRGSDGTVGASKHTLEIVGEATGLQGQGSFVYDSNKAGTVTVSHLRFSPEPIRNSSLIRQAQVLACHHWDLLERLDLLELACPEAVVLLNTPWPPQHAWEHMPLRVRQQIHRKRLRLFGVDAAAIAQAHGLGGRINTVMQACFFAVSGLMPMDQAMAALRQSIQRSYASKGPAVVAANLAALEAAPAALQPLPIGPPPWVVSAEEPLAEQPLPEGLAEAPAACRELLLPQLQHRGDALPVSALPCDGSFPTATSQWEKRNTAEQVPVWEPDLCVQCGKCVLVCPHAVIRAKLALPQVLQGAPQGFRHTAARERAFAGEHFTIQVSAEDCTGCRLCVEVCPARDRSDPARKALNMAPQRPLREQSHENWAFFLQLPEVERSRLNPQRIQHQQLQRPLFEFPGACAGCGETPYLKVLSQLFGDRLLIANATGCSSIYGGNLPTTPWCTDANGRGPAWSNPLFETNAEFGLGFRLGLDQRHRRAEQLLRGMAEQLPPALLDGLLQAQQGDEPGIHEQRLRVAELKPLLTTQDTPAARELLELADDLVKRSVWIVGGDGWAYDIGFGGLDHVLAGQDDVNVLVLDTEVYSNTGGQRSKATPKGAVTPFASGGKASAKKDLGLMAMTYGHVYVASVAMGARDEHTLRCFLEAESYPGPSLILAYSHCIAHGIDMGLGMQQQQRAVASGRWLLYRHDPRRRAQGLSALVLDQRRPQLPLAEAMATEQRFSQLHSSDPARAQSLAQEAEAELQQRWELYQRLAQ